MPNMLPGISQVFNNMWIIHVVSLVYSGTAVSLKSCLVSCKLIVENKREMASCGQGREEA